MEDICMAENAYGQDLPPDLVEVVDARNYPICLMPGPEAARQRLPRRSIAIVIRDRRGNFLLALDDEERPGFTRFAPACTGFAYIESCEKIMKEHWGSIPASTALLRVWPPCPENGNTFCGVCEIVPGQAVFESIASSEKLCIVADRVTIKTLEESSIGLSPFFRLVYSSALWVF